MFAIAGCSSDVVEAPPPAAPDRLEFRVGPTRAIAGVPFDPAVQVVIRRLDGTIDSTSTAQVSITSLSPTVVGGNRVTSATGPVAIAITTGPVGASLTGTVTANLVAGEANLGDVRLPRAGVG